MKNVSIETRDIYIITYLEIAFDANMYFKTAADDLKTKSSKTLFSLSYAISNIDVVVIHLQLFDSLIKPIVTCGRDVRLPNQYGTFIKSTIHKIDTIPFEKLYCMFCKRPLGVYKSTSNVLINI